MTSEQEQRLRTLLGELHYSTAQLALSVVASPTSLVGVMGWVKATSALCQQLLDLNLSVEDQANYAVDMGHAVDTNGRQIARIFKLDSLRAPDSPEGLT